MDYGQTDESRQSQMSEANSPIVDYMRNYDFSRSVPTSDGPCGCASCVSRASLNWPMLKPTLQQTEALKQAIEEPTMSTSAQQAALAELVGNSPIGRILSEILEQNPGMTLNSVTQGGDPSEGPADFMRGMKLDMGTLPREETGDTSPINYAQGLREAFARGLRGLPGGVVNGAGQSAQQVAAFRAAEAAAKPEVIQGYVTSRVIPDMMRQLSNLLDTDMTGQERLRQQRRILKRTDTLMGYVANPQKIQPRTIACPLELGIYKHYLAIQVTNKSLPINQSYDLITIAEEALQQRQADVEANKLKLKETKRLDQLEASLKIDIAKAFDDLGNLSLTELTERLQALTTAAQK